ncbi:MAG: protein kinase, partial [Planctomycetaceae bacterium]|nr:protein kinase [Planctomycetaceae bacterium]
MAQPHQDDSFQAKHPTNIVEPKPLHNLLLGLDDTDVSSTNPTEDYDQSVAITLAFCMSTGDGSISPPLCDEDQVELQATFAIGSHIGRRYKLRSSLGRGGMGHVFLAHDERLGRPVAVKIVVDDTNTPLDKQQQTMTKEARLGASLNHTGIATVFDFGVQCNRFFIVFEYIDGLSLREILKHRGKLAPDEVRQILAALADALDYSHSRGVVHRDLKPENLKVAKDGRLRILDLGLARDLKRDYATHFFSGTPAYAAPEQAACRPTDSRCDQYSLAIIAYELLTGYRPFVSEDPLELLRMHQSKSPDSPRLRNATIPADLESAVLRALEKDPARRFATCREFAEAAGFSLPQITPSFQLQSLETPEKQRLGVYVTHVGSDSLVASRLAESLEQSGFSTWVYQRDAAPGISYRAQVESAMRRCSSVLLLISRDSLSSRDFVREIEEANQFNRPFLPVLVHLSLEEFASLQPEWRTMLGGAAIVELDSPPHLQTVQRLITGLESLGIPRSACEQPPIVKRPEPLTGAVWATDANQIEIQDLPQVIFRNEAIDDFLKPNGRYFLSATKGLGKTLILTYKRLMLTESLQSRQSGNTVCMIPQGRPFLDFMSEMRSLSKNYEQPLSDLKTTKRIWGAALRIAIISHHPDVVHSEDEFELESLPERLRLWMRGTKIAPTVVFKELTRLPVSQLNHMIDESENFLDQKLRLIHGATYVFVDKVDQAVGELPRAAWINIQAGLIEAAWELMNANSHVKIFTSIRQEAFANYQSEIKSNLYGATTILRYDEQELRQLLDTLSRYYESCRSFQDFVGLNVVKHPRRPLPEDSFRFVRRHTLGRPRDFVAIASELSRSRNSLSEEKFCSLVRQTAELGLVTNIFDEMRVFLDCLHDRETRFEFLRMLPANILSREEAVAISAAYNGISSESLQQFGEESPELFHPFRDLYMTGLLGNIAEDQDTDRLLQKFRQPEDQFSDLATELPNSDYYFLHPALSGFVRRHRSNADFYVYQHVLVGENGTWRPFDPVFCELERQMARLTDV